MGNKSSLVGLAKGRNYKPVTPTKKSVEKKIESVIEKQITPEEERDLKAKKKVEELLQHVDLAPKIVIVEEIESETNERPVDAGVEWFEEQLAMLSNENERLRNECEVAKDDYRKLYHESQGKGSEVNERILQNLLMMFNELQDNLTGNNRERTAWSTANISHLLGKMVQLFPFLEKYKKG